MKCMLLKPRSFRQRLLRLTQPIRLLTGAPAIILLLQSAQAVWLPPLKKVLRPSPRLRQTGSGVTGTFDVTVTKKPATESAKPTFTKDLDTAKSVTVGDSVTLSVTASASDGGKLTYQWYKGSTAISGATGASYTFTADKVGSESYKVVVTNTKRQFNTCYCDQ